MPIRTRRCDALPQAADMCETHAGEASGQARLANRLQGLPSIQNKVPKLGKRRATIQELSHRPAADRLKAGQGESKPRSAITTEQTKKGCAQTVAQPLIHLKTPRCSR